MLRGAVGATEGRGRGGEMLVGPSTSLESVFSSRTATLTFAGYDTAERRVPIPRSAPYKGRGVRSDHDVAWRRMARPSLTVTVWNLERPSLCPRETIALHNNFFGTLLVSGQFA